MATPYCSQADLVERFGVQELAQLTDETAAASPDATEITNACDEATSLIDSYVARRYVTPLDPVPTIVRKWACDLARKFLWKDRAGPDSVVSINADAVMAQLRDVSRGTAALPDATGVQPSVSGGIVSVTSSTQIFTDDVLALM